jgi:hypothetical protein
MIVASPHFGPGVHLRTPCRGLPPVLLQSLCVSLAIHVEKDQREGGERRGAMRRGPETANGPASEAVGCPCTVHLVKHGVYFHSLTSFVPILPLFRKMSPTQARRVASVEGFIRSWEATKFSNARTKAAAIPCTAT